MKAKDLLKELNACKEAIDWVGDMTIQEAWETCHRGDWMLWFYQKQYPCNIKEITLAKGHCANTVRHLMRDDRSLRAVDTAISFGEGIATKEELDAAASAAAAAYTAAAYAAYAAAVSAAYAAAVSAVSAASAAAVSAASAASANAYAAAAYAANAYDSSASYASYVENQLQTADICRKYLAIGSKLCNND